MDLLDKYSVKATFFVSGVNALSHPEIIREIIARGTPLAIIHSIIILL
jgi:peptidoglycan/xylan/chitin deacetylase (PgdA/CDA1 family)